MKTRRKTSRAPKNIPSGFHLFIIALLLIALLGALFLVQINQGPERAAVTLSPIPVSYRWESTYKSKIYSGGTLCPAGGLPRLGDGCSSLGKAGRCLDDKQAQCISGKTTSAVLCTCKSAGPILKPTATPTFSFVVKPTVVPSVCPQRQGNCWGYKKEGSSCVNMSSNGLCSDNQRSVGRACGSEPNLTNCTGWTCVNDSNCGCQIKTAKCSAARTASSITIENITWSKTSSTTAQNIDISWEGVSPWVPVRSVRIPFGSSTYTITGLKAGTKYLINVNCFKSFGSFSSSINGVQRDPRLSDDTIKSKTYDPNCVTLAQ